MTKPKEPTPERVSGTWRGAADPRELLIVVQTGRGRAAHRALLHPGDHLAPDGTWSAELTGAFERAWAVLPDEGGDPDELLVLRPAQLDARRVGTVRSLAPTRARKAADEGELKAILALPARPFPALPSRKLLPAYRDYAEFLGLDLDQDLHRLLQNDLDRARKKFAGSALHDQVGEILQARLNSRDAVSTYFHKAKTLLNSVSIDASNFIERAAAWMSLTQQKPQSPIAEFFRIFLEMAGLIAGFVSAGTTKTAIDAAKSVATIFEAAVKLVDGDRSGYPNLDNVHIAKAELLGALTDWKRAGEATIDEIQALVLRDATKLERASRLVFPEKTEPVVTAVGKAWGRIIWLKLLPTRTVLVKQGVKRVQRKDFNNDEAQVQKHLTDKLAAAVAGTSARDAGTVTFGYYKSRTGRKRRKYYYVMPRWTLRLGIDDGTDFNVDAFKSLRACKVTPHDIIVSLKLPIRVFTSTPGIPPKEAANLWTDVYWVGIHGRRHYMNRAQWDSVGKKGRVSWAGAVVGVLEGLGVAVEERATGDAAGRRRRPQGLRSAWVLCR